MTGIRFHRPINLFHMDWQLHTYKWRENDKMNAIIENDCVHFIVSYKHKMARRIRDFDFYKRL